MLLKRESYLKNIRQYYDMDLIKVLTGVRRCGKSKLLESIMNEIKESGILESHIIYVNFEDFDYEYIDCAMQLNTFIKSKITDDKKYYIFLDEIQHVDQFEKANASFKATLNVSVFITGSNSKLLSGDLSTLLTGRTVEFEIQPFTYQEMRAYFQLNDRVIVEEDIYDYIKWGGFPQRFDIQGDNEIRRYLQALYQSIISKDILSGKEGLEKVRFNTISTYVMANAGKEFSVDNVTNYYNNKNNNNKKTISRNTIYSYIEKMEKAYLLKRVKRFNITGKEVLKTRQKHYAVDMGFRTIMTNTAH